jgi:hypothetical protein
MQGLPITRVTSPDGRWAYTLYDGAGKHPFVHALDTAVRRAVCIDLHALGGRKDLYALRLAVGAGGGTLTVRDGARPLAVVDTASFRVHEPGEAPAGPPNADGEAGRAWTLAATLGAAALAATAGGLAIARRRRRLAPD